MAFEKKKLHINPKWLAFGATLFGFAASTTFHYATGMQYPKNNPAEQLIESAIDEETGVKVDFSSGLK